MSSIIDDLNVILTNLRTAIGKVEGNADVRNQSDDSHYLDENGTRKYQEELNIPEFDSYDPHYTYRLFNLLSRALQCSKSECIEIVADFGSVYVTLTSEVTELYQELGNLTTTLATSAHFLAEEWQYIEGKGGNEAGYCRITCINGDDLATIEFINLIDSVCSNLKFYTQRKEVALVQATYSQQNARPIEWVAQLCDDSEAFKALTGIDVVKGRADRLTSGDVSIPPVSEPIMIEPTWGGLSYFFVDTKPQWSGWRGLPGSPAPVEVLSPVPTPPSGSQ